MRASGICHPVSHGTMARSLQGAGNTAERPKELRYSGGFIMKTTVWMLALSLAVGYAVAQDRPADQNAAPQAQEHQNAAANAPGPGRNTPAEMKTSNYKGTLVDMGCKEGSDCKVSANSEKLGMKLDDGRTMRFDMVGNERTKDQLKNNKHWTKTMTDGKPIRATVSGAISGDKLIVSSIH
jgi:hypothetical protein